MLRNYFTIGLRNILKYKGYSVINISGLAVGIACFLLIFLYVKDDLTYDQMHRDSESIFRITSKVKFGGSVSTRGATGHPDTDAYREEIPEIGSMARLDNDIAIIKKGDNYIEQRGVVYADPALFDIFDFKLIQGEVGEAFNDLNNIVVSESMALKYFDKKNVVGKTLQMNLENEMEQFYVVAVMEDHPDNSSFTFGIVVPWAKRRGQVSARQLNSWSNISLNAFVKLADGATVETVEAKMAQIRTAKNPGEGGDFARSIVNELQPLSDIHLNTDIGGGDGMGFSAEANDAYLLSAIALIILIVACINFANLSIARSLPRAREIGLRKVLGAGRRQLVFQFLGEALLMSFSAFVLGLILAELALPVFGSLTERTFSEGIMSDLYIVLACFAVVLLTALMAGLYPAFVVSKFDTVKSLKGKISISGNSWIPKALVVFQFTTAVILIVGTLTMNKQVDFMVDMDLGYEDEQLVRVEAYGSGKANIAQLFINELSGNPAVLDVAAADDFSSRTPASYQGNDFLTVITDAHHNYPDLLGLELVEGRLLKKGEDYFVRDTDTLTNVVVNEAFAREAGMESPISQSFRRFRIVGVLKDFHFRSVQEAVTPLMFTSQNEASGKEFEEIYVRYSAAHAARIETVLETAWQKLVPDRPFEAAFVAHANAQRYEEEARWRVIMGCASVLAISISVLGLFGLAHLATQQRVKEVGIRQVLGASLTQIMLLLNSGFTKLVLVSVVLATPIAYWLVDAWLDDFANQTELTVSLFLVPGLITFSITLITVSLQSFKSLNANPVDSLRYD